MRDFLDADERGAVAIIAAVSLLALLLSAAFAVDLGAVAQAQERGRHAVEAAALSGAELLGQGDSPTQVVTASEAYLAENYPELSAGWDSCPSGETPAGFTPPSGAGEDCIAFDGTSAISVALPPQTVDYTLARVAYLDSATVNASAAAVASSGTAACAFCLLATPGTTLSASGDTGVDVTGGAVVVDSSGTPAVATSGSVSISGTAIDVTGTVSSSGTADFAPTPKTGVAPIPDPLAYLSAPTPSSSTLPSKALSCSGSSTVTATAGEYGSVTMSDSCDVTIPPGNYSSISVSGSGTLTLETGSYFITGPFSMSGSASIAESGAGVFLYFTCGSTTVTACASGSAGGSLSLSGSGSVDLSPLTSGPYAGLTVFYDRDDASSLTLSGSSEFSISGTFYAKSAQIALSGSGFTLQSMVVAASATLSGSAVVGVDYVPSQNIAIPGAPYLCSVSAGNC